MPSWLLGHLQRTGRLDIDGVHRTTGRGRCARCHAVLLVGLDSDLCGLIARVDPWPVDRLSEFIAIVTGRWTYNLVRSATSSGKRCWNIDRRADYHISAAQKWIVVAEHRCGAPLPADDENIPTDIPVGVKADECPF